MTDDKIDKWDLIIEPNRHLLDIPVKKILSISTVCAVLAFSSVASVNAIGGGLGMDTSMHHQKSKHGIKKMAKYLAVNPDVYHVYYPGLKGHPDYKLAKKQMKDFGGMLSFELIDGIDAMKFQNNLKLIKPSMSLAGVESTMLSPAQTSHALLSVEERAKQGIKDGLIRFSVGIEETKDLINDIEQAIKKAKN